MKEYKGFMAVFQSAQDQAGTPLDISTNLADVCSGRAMFVGSISFNNNFQILDGLLEIKKDEWKNVWDRLIFNSDIVSFKENIIESIENETFILEMKLVEKNLNKKCKKGKRNIFITEHSILPIEFSVS